MFDCCTVPQPEMKWACLECAANCNSKNACRKCAKDNDEDACGCCEHPSPCRPWACGTCFSGCRSPSECLAGTGCGTCECPSMCQPWCCPGCGAQCKNPSACGPQIGDACGTCSCPAFCVPNSLPMDGVVPPGGYHLADTVSRRALGDGESLPTDCVVFVGDSDIEYWQDSGWSASFPDMVNIGIGGATIREAARHVESMVAAMRPKGFVVLCSGENDMDADTAVEPLFKLWKFVVTTILESENKPRVIMISTKPEPNAEQDGLWAVYKPYDDMIKEYISQLGDGSIVFIDLWEAFEAIGNPRELYRDDGLHMTDMGYEILTEKVKATLNE